MNEILQKKIKELPQLSGVYIMRNSKNEVIYVGKAKLLNKRVSQYFSHAQKTNKVQMMVNSINDFEYVITPSELDAFILENSLIKKYQPFYNILLKDGKQYPYIRVGVNETYPTFTVVRKIISDGSKYFGPYYGSVKADEILETINYAYPIRTCKLKFKINSKPLKRECLNYSLGLCCAPCTNKISRDEYLKIVKGAMGFLQGNDKDILKILHDKMMVASLSENFENALLLRDRIKMVNNLSEKVVVDLAKFSSYDVVSFASNGESCCANLLIVRNGKILGGKNFNLLNGVDEAQVKENFILQLYSQEIFIPNKILINQENFDFEMVKLAIEKVSNAKIMISCPKKGSLKKLVDMSFKNANDFLEKSLTDEKKKLSESVGAVLQLQKALHLSKPLKRIECYDISHISGVLKVGSMVVFENGTPCKNMYRKFKIKTVEGSNDFACLQEVLKRRIVEYDKNEDVSFSKLPDLIVIDGGKGQLSSVCEIIKNTTFDKISIISLAKKQEEIFIPHVNLPILLAKGSLGLRILQNIRDEAHRFAITYHRLIRNKKSLESEFDNIKGIGKIIKTRLYEKFLSAENVRNKSVEDLIKIEGISKEKAIQILKQLN